MKKNFAAEAVSNIPRSHYCREEEGGTRLAKEGGSSKQRREGRKEGKKKGLMTLRGTLFHRFILTTRRVTRLEMCIYAASFN